MRRNARWMDLLIGVPATDGNVYFVDAYRVTRSADIQTDIETTLVQTQRNEYTIVEDGFVPQVGERLTNEHETLEEIISVIPLYTEGGNHIDRYRITTDKVGI